MRSEEALNPVKTLTLARDLTQGRPDVDLPCHYRNTDHSPHKVLGPKVTFRPNSWQNNDSRETQDVSGFSRDPFPEYLGDRSWESLVGSPLN